MRCYPTITDAELRFEDGAYIVRVVIKNYGSSPSLGTRIALRVSVENPDKAFYIDEKMLGDNEPGDNGWGRIISPNDTTEIWSRVSAEANLALSQIDNQDLLYCVMVDTKLIALDVLGKPIIRTEHWHLFGITQRPVAGTLHRAPANFRAEWYDRDRAERG